MRDKNNKLKVSTIITLKKEVLDPQGKVIKSALDGMGFNNIHEIRQGKYFEIEIDEKWTVHDRIDDTQLRPGVQLGFMF